MLWPKAGLMLAAICDAGPYSAWRQTRHGNLTLGYGYGYAAGGGTSAVFCSALYKNIVLLLFIILTLYGLSGVKHLAYKMFLPNFLKHRNSWCDDRFS